MQTETYNHIFVLGHRNISNEEQWFRLKEIQAVCREGNYTVVYMKGNRTFTIIEEPQEFLDQATE